MRSTHRRLGAVLATLASAVAVLAGTVVAPAPTAAVESDETRFYAGVPYTGEYASPQVLVDKGRYYAFATTEDGLNLPAMHSDDLATWIPRDPLPDYHLYRSWKLFNDAMPQPASWATTAFRAGAERYAVWAPAVAKMGRRYVAAYAVMVNWKKQRLCISLAYADHPEGKYADRSSKPIVCSSDTRGSIDPDLIKVGKRNFLIWKNSGVRGSKPTQIWVRELNGSATAFRTGSTAHHLLTTQQPWEGNVIEAPDMIRYDGRFYLFYSGNSYTTRRYATGYAICQKVTGPCRRARNKPLLATNGAVVAPGGAAPFKDLRGRLRLAYHAWSAAEVGATTPAICGECPPRRLHLATLRPGATGLLRVTDLR